MGTAVTSITSRIVISSRIVPHPCVPPAHMDSQQDGRTVWPTAGRPLRRPACTHAGLLACVYIYIAYIYIAYIYIGYIYIYISQITAAPLSCAAIRALQTSMISSYYRCAPEVCI